MREHITTVWQIVQKSEVNRAATWLYRWVLLALVTFLVLNQAGTPPAQVVEVVNTVAYTGVALAAWYLLAPVVAEAYRVRRRGVDG